MLKSVDRELLLGRSVPECSEHIEKQADLNLFLIQWMQHEGHEKGMLGAMTPSMPSPRVPLARKAAQRDLGRKFVQNMRDGSLRTIWFACSKGDSCIE